jgi:hypothetical protein
MKPLGISMTFDANGLPRLGCPRPSGAEDAIWDAVRQAIGEGMTPKRFKEEVAQAWEQELRDDMKAAGDELRK